MKVDQLMTRAVRTCGPDAPLSEAVRLMKELDCGVVPVVDGDGRVEGVVTDRDAALTALEGQCPFDRLRVSDAMTPDVRCCAEDDSVERAEELMRRHRLRRLVIVDSKGRLSGMLTLGDVARSGLRPHQLAATLAAVCEIPEETPDATAVISA